MSGSEFLNERLSGLGYQSMERGTFNGTDCDSFSKTGAAGDKHLIHELFLEQAARRPGNIAVVSAGRTLTYKDLLSDCSGLARTLRRSGARSNQPIAIVMDKGWEQIAGVLAILKFGAPYLPIDPAVPTHRLEQLLQDGEIEIVLTQSWVDRDTAWPSNIKRICVDMEIGECKDGEDASVPKQNADDLAYILYTSGSTGSPKGVMISHRGLVNCIRETNRCFAVCDTDRILAVTSLHHDMSAFDIFGILGAGGTIVIPDKCASRAPDHWLDLMREYGVTIWNSVPAFFQMLLDYIDSNNLTSPCSLRLAFLGGDWIPLSMPGRARIHFPKIQPVSVGGPTETTLWNIWYPIQDIDPAWKSIPYGHPIENTRYYVLDEALEECPQGIVGELWCAGVGLMKGYWRDPDQTKTKFAIHPKTGESIYRTGDLGRRLSDGEIEFGGRIDGQVKILGQRIELGEIEAVLSRIPGIRQAAATVISVAGQSRLAAYFVTGPPRRISAAEARTHLEKKLPRHMVPAVIEAVTSLPLTDNGKVNRSALPMPSSWVSGVPSPPTAEAQDPLQKIWREVLKLESVGVDENFFDLGGNSLLLVRVHGEIQRQLGLKLPIVALFEFSTVRSLRRHLDQMNNADEPLQLTDRRMLRRRAIERLRSVKDRND